MKFTVQRVHSDCRSRQEYCRRDCWSGDLCIFGGKSAIETRIDSLLKEKKVRVKERKIVCYIQEEKFGKISNRRRNGSIELVVVEIAV